MITLQSAENALKTVYLGAVTELLNTKSNPLLARIEQTTADVWGKEIKTAARAGIVGGIGAGDETGELPKAAASKYVQFTATLKNLYGQIEISDKAIRASAGGKGAFTDILNAELEGLLSASKFNLGRMLYGDGSGELTRISDTVGGFNYADDPQNLIEGMVVDIYCGNELIMAGAVVKHVMRETDYIKLQAPEGHSVDEIPTDSSLFVQGSRGKEITGLGALFDSAKPLYGNNRSDVPFLAPYRQAIPAGKLDEIVLQKAMDSVERHAGVPINFIAVSAEAKYAYQEYMAQYKRNIDMMELDGGYKTMSYNGIPLVYDRFIKKGVLYLLDTGAFKMHQLCDWRYLENENGKILRQTQGRPTYTATLVKYCDLVCNRPNGQAMLTGVLRDNLS
ncbi:MAG: phage major capsid protein, partial [Clostridiales bacterium]|jgi:hypothetical protein|nr:phage major capsid protein [Clostridiales bacterium]